MRLGKLSIQQVAERLGCDPRKLRGELKVLHELKGGLLFQHKARGRNAKMWVDEGRLRELLPEHFGVPKERDIGIIHGRIDRVELLAERALTRVGELARKVRRCTRE